MTSAADARAGVEEPGMLARFRTNFYNCLSARADALFELCDALLCADGPVKTLVGLALAPEHRRGHGALYDALGRGRIELTRLRATLAGLPLPLPLPRLRRAAGAGRGRDLVAAPGRGDHRSG